MPFTDILPWRYLAILLVANLALALPDAAPLRVAGALLLIGLLPGLSWANRLLANTAPLFRWTTAFALSYTFTTLVTLLLHYLPGPVHLWQLLVALNALAIVPVVINKSRAALRPRSQQAEGQGSTGEAPPSPAPLLLHSPALLFILLIALGLRSLNLNYSEFQGDEALAMITAAEALEGHEDALFLRAKGPGEVLVPMALWRLTGVTNEAIARLPFVAAAMLATVSIYLIGQELGGQRLGWLAAGFFAFNGFTVAFGRIVQYQALVLWMSTMAFLLTLRWRQTGQQRFAILGGLCLGVGLLAHYDAILVLPAIIWLFASASIRQLPLKTAGKDLVPTQNVLSTRRFGIRDWQFPISNLQSLISFFVALLLVALPFYLPFSLDPQANRTGEYVGARIGTSLHNHLPQFFHFNTLYSSSYYLILTGLLVLGLLTWFLWQARRGRRWIPVVLVTAALTVTFNPNLLDSDSLDLSILPFGLLLLGAFFALPYGKHIQAVIAWLAVPFLGYNFVVSVGLTHIYTIVPAWSVLAAMGWYRLFDAPDSISDSTVRARLTGPASQSQNPSKFSFANTQRALCLQSLIPNLLLIGLLILSTIFLWNAFVRHDVEYRQDYPTGNLSAYWTPYDRLPPAGFFGFAHRAGWKAVGQKIATGELAGDYGSNEEPDVTTWYTRGAPRACDPQPEFYFLAGDRVDPVEVPDELIKANYEEIGRVTLPNRKQMQIMQHSPGTLAMGELDDAILAREFDRSARPAAFARSARGSIAVEVNFANLVRLIGYDLDTRRAYPGGRVPVTLYWQAMGSLSTSYQVFTHLESDSGPVAQADGVPVCWTYSTDLWRPGQIIADQHAILIPNQVLPGNYPLQVGLYLAGTSERLNVLDEAGNPAGTSVVLDVVEIGRKEIGD